VRTKENQEKYMRCLHEESCGHGFAGACKDSVLPLSLPALPYCLFLLTASLAYWYNFSRKQGHISYFCGVFKRKRLGISHLKHTVILKQLITFTFGLHQ